MSDYTDSPIPAQSHNDPEYSIRQKTPRVDHIESGIFKFAIMTGGELEGILLKNAPDPIYMYEGVTAQDWEDAFLEASEYADALGNFYALVDNPVSGLSTSQSIGYAHGMADYLVREMQAYLSAEQARAIREYLYDIRKAFLNIAEGGAWASFTRFVAMPHVPPNGYVYLVRSVTGAYKIGLSKDPKSRIATFGVLLPFEIEYESTIQTSDMRGFERALHGLFDAKRVGGEWFMLTQQDVNVFAYLEHIMGGLR